MERCEKAFGKVFSLDGRDTYGRILGNTSANDRQNGAAGITGESRCGAGGKPKIKRRRDVGNAGEVNRLMMLCSGDIDEQLLGLRFSDGIVVGDHRSSQGDRREAAREKEKTEKCQEYARYRGDSVVHYQWPAIERRPQLDASCTISIDRRVAAG